MKQRTTQVIWSGLCVLVENVEVPLVLYLANDTTLLEQVICDSGTDRLAMVIKQDLEVFALQTIIREYSSTRISSYALT